VVTASQSNPPQPPTLFFKSKVSLQYWQRAHKLPYHESNKSRCVPSRPITILSCHPYLDLCYHSHCALLLFLINPLNAELNPICHLLALLGVHHFLHVSRIRVNHMLTLMDSNLQCECKPSECGEFSYLQKWICYKLQHCLQNSNHNWHRGTWTLIHQCFHHLEKTTYQHHLCKWICWYAGIRRDLADRVCEHLVQGLCLKLTELHTGWMWVEMELGLSSVPKSEGLSLMPTLRK